MATTPLARPMAGFWARVEAWIVALQADRPRMARYLRVAYWISNAVVVLGVIIVILVQTGRWSL